MLHTTPMATLLSSALTRSLTTIVMTIPRLARKAVLIIRAFRRSCYRYSLGHLLLNVLVGSIEYYKLFVNIEKKKKASYLARPLMDDRNNHFNKDTFEDMTESRLNRFLSLLHALSRELRWLNHRDRNSDSCVSAPYGQDAIDSKAHRRQL